jgi:hypothetical protein
VRSIVRRIAVASAAIGLLAGGATSAGATTARGGEGTVSAGTFNTGNDFVAGSAVATGGAIHGMALTQADKPFEVGLSDVTRLAEDGVNTVNLYITEYQANAYANDVFDGSTTPTTSEVEAAVKLAHANGLAVELMPTVWTAGSFMWRGDYRPGDVKHWFASYTAMIDRWAAVAQSSGAELFAVGTEYQALQGHTADWRKVIASVRSIYHGTLTYMATAGSYSTVKFWKSLDLIGISPYWTLSKAAVPSVADLKTAWQRVLAPVAAFSRREHRPVLFDELGYESIRGAADRPFAHPNGTPSERAQANAYQAAIDAVAGSSWLRGLVFFTWGLPEAPAVDTSYNPGGKLAECVVAENWASSANEVDGVPPICPIVEAAAG